ncbi:MAG: C10 family peptidase, partial [Bacteroidota bacterium]|nr:C10 family peptidase [Bacteroidota bacterium]
MKRLLYILVIFSMIIGLPCQSQPIDSGQARIVAQNFLQEKATQLDYTSNPTLTVNRIFVKEHDNQAIYYVVQFKKSGFVIVTAHQKLSPVLGFSPDGSYDPDNLPPALAHWMHGYESQAIKAMDHQSYQSQEIRKLWERYLFSNPDNDVATPAINKAGPLLHTTWEQGNHYNAYCPEDPAGPGGHTYSGCVATAMAQVMYHFRHPLAGTGSLTYVDPVYDTLSANFGNTEYRWNEMVPWIMGGPNTAIAELIYHCGVSIETLYTPVGSGAYTSDCAAALCDYFNYKPSATYYYRSNQNIQWKDSLVKNIDKGQPVLYRGGPFWSAHSFICDGYVDSSYFHFNFGWWQGNGNGYYYLDNLTPFHYTFTDGQAGVFNIYPEGTYPPTQSGMELLSTAKGSFHDGSGPLNYTADIDACWLISPEGIEEGKIMLYFNEFQTETNRDILTVYDGNNTDAPIIGKYSGNDIPASITSSGKDLLVHFSSDQQNHGQGWLVHYTTVTDAYCSSWANLSDTSGYLYDGSWIIYDYANNSDCYWLIEPQIPEHDSISGIGLVFSEFNTEKGIDLLRIYDGPTINDPILAEFSGDTLPMEIISANNSVLVHFSSNDQITASGFMGSFHCIFPEYCNDTIQFTASTGTFSDGSGDKYYNKNSDCYWLIAPTDAEYISLSFRSFDVENGYDWIKIYDPSIDPPTELAFLSGDQIPE